MDEPNTSFRSSAETNGETDSNTVTETQLEPQFEVAALREAISKKETVEDSLRFESAELAHIHETLATISEGIVTLQTGFDSKIKYDASKERMVETLHKELQSYRDDLHFKILKPLFLDLISMHDDITTLLRHRDSEEESTSQSEKNLRQSVKTFQGTIEDILERNGVNTYAEDGTAFVPQRQRILKTIETAEEERNTQIAERLRKGFEYSGRVLRPEIVSTFRFKLGSQQPTSFENNREV